MESERVNVCADVFLIPLGGCDLVLCVQWFSTLGKVQFDFTAHTIDFCWKGKQILLRGAVTTPFSTVDSKKMHKTLQVAGELSMMQVFALHKDDNGTWPQVNVIPSTTVLPNDIQQ